MAVKKLYTCILCGEEKSAHQVAKHRNDNVASGVGFCKTCLKNEVDGTNVYKAKDMMRLMNIPFVTDVWENAIATGGSNVFSKYLQLIATQRDYKSFFDSVEGRDTGNTGVSLSKTELIAKWGVQKDENKYIEYEAAYDNLVSIKPPATTLDQKRYAQNVMIEHQLNFALGNGADHKEITALKKLYESNIRELGLDIDAQAKDDEVSLGEKIRNWELNAPIPMEEKYEDVDKYGYMSKWFATTMKRVFGKASEEEIRSLYE